MLRSERTALASRVYDVRGQIEVARMTIEEVKELTDLVRAGLVVSLENLQDELESIEQKLTPPPVSARDVVPMFDGSNVVGLRLVA